MPYVSSEAFARYLSDGAAPASARTLADELGVAGLATESELLRRYAHAVTTATFADQPIYIGPRPPVAAKYGEYWFDTCELSTMILLPFYVDPTDRPHLSDEARVRIEESRAWFSIHPVRAFQYRAFLAAAPLDGRFGTDGARSELDAVTRVTCAQAGAYLYWFGKSFPNETHWQSARDFFATPPWGTPAREWIGESSFDDTKVVALSPDTIDVDPENDDTMVYAWDAVPDDVTFRSAVLMLYGLQTEDVPMRSDGGAGVRGRLQRPS